MHVQPSMPTICLSGSLTLIKPSSFKFIRPATLLSHKGQKRKHNRRTTKRCPPEERGCEEMDVAMALAVRHENSASWTDKHLDWMFPVIFTCLFLTWTHCHFCKQHTNTPTHSGSGSFGIGLKKVNSLAPHTHTHTDIKNKSSHRIDSKTHLPSPSVGECA